MTKSRQLSELYQDILEMEVCAGLRQHATQLVMGDGNLDADIVCIGEAPGKKEDEQGRPFVGASGKFLNEMLAAAGLNRSDVYITNIVKYRPPNNRDPHVDEKKAFWPFLLKELEIISPKVVITLGRHSGVYFIPGLVISRDHGKPQKIVSKGRDLLVIPLYHPAAALYNGNMRQTLIDDFLRVSELIAKQK